MIKQSKKKKTKKNKQTLDIDWLRFKYAAARSRKSCKKTYNYFISSSVASDSKGNPKRYFSFIESKENEKNLVFQVDYLKKLQKK